MILDENLARFGLGYGALLDLELRLGLGYDCSCVRLVGRVRFEAYLPRQGMCAYRETSN